MDDNIIIAAVVGLIGLLLVPLLLRPRRQPLTLVPPRARGHQSPTVPRRRHSLGQQIDAAFDALEIKGAVRLPSVEITFDDPPPKAADIRHANKAADISHSKFDISDSPSSDELPGSPSYELDAASAFGAEPTVFDAAAFGLEPTADVAAAFGPEPTLTVVEDDDGMSVVEELAAFLARDELTALTPPRAARGSQVPIDRARTFRGDLRAAIPQRRHSSPSMTPVIPRRALRGRPETARTPR